MPIDHSRCKSLSARFGAAFGAMLNSPQSYEIERLESSSWVRDQRRGARHRERSEAIQSRGAAALDCFVAALLAMTPPLPSRLLVTQSNQSAR
jgi:hypothetical protein